jgi:hypothetical protein
MAILQLGRSLNFKRHKIDFLDASYFEIYFNCLKLIRNITKITAGMYLADIKPKVKVRENLLSEKMFSKILKLQPYFIFCKPVALFDKNKTYYRGICSRASCNPGGGAA